MSTSTLAGTRVAVGGPSAAAGRDTGTTRPDEAGPAARTQQVSRRRAHRTHHARMALGRAQSPREQVNALFDALRAIAKLLPTAVADDMWEQVGADLHRHLARARIRERAGRRATSTSTATNKPAVTPRDIHKAGSRRGSRSAPRS